MTSAEVRRARPAALLGLVNIALTYGWKVTINPLGHSVADADFEGETYSADFHRGGGAGAAHYGESVRIVWEWGYEKRGEQRWVPRLMRADGIKGSLKTHRISDIGPILRAPAVAVFAAAPETADEPTEVLRAA